MFLYVKNAFMREYNDTSTRIHKTSEKNNKIAFF